jgi:hypothetical protein
LTQALPAIIAALLLLLGALGLALSYGGNHALLWALGAALGYTLYRGSFSFAGGFRQALAEGRSAGLRAQMLMLGILVIITLPAIHAGTLAGAQGSRLSSAPSSSASACNWAGAALPARSTPQAAAIRACC